MSKTLGLLLPANLLPEAQTPHFDFMKTSRILAMDVKIQLAEYLKHGPRTCLRLAVRDKFCRQNGNWLSGAADNPEFILPSTPNKRRGCNAAVALGR